MAAQALQGAALVRGSAKADFKSDRQGRAHAKCTTYPLLRLGLSSAPAPPGARAPSFIFRRPLRRALFPRAESAEAATATPLTPPEPSRREGLPRRPAPAVPRSSVPNAARPGRQPLSLVASRPAPAASTRRAEAELRPLHRAATTLSA
eukprot:scaffold878_cov271-Pinguiococcus_pyrenoidosus.AAC.58